MFKPEQHNFTKDAKVCHWQYCTKCGILALRNEFSQWAVKVGCNYADHPSYAAQRNRTNPFK